MGDSWLYDMLVDMREDSIESGRDLGYNGMLIWWNPRRDWDDGEKPALAMSVDELVSQADSERMGSGRYADYSAYAYCVYTVADLLEVAGGDDGALTNFASVEEFLTKYVKGIDRFMGG